MANLQGVVDLIKSASSVINTLLAFAIGLAVLLFIFGLFKYLTAGGDPEQLKAARNTIILGVIIIAVMVGIWGLVNFVVKTVGVEGQNTPTSIPQVPTQ